MHRSSLRRRLGIFCVVLVTACVALSITGAKAQASLTSSTAKKPCTGYGFTCDPAYGRVAYQSYWSMYAGHNCTNYVAWRLIQEGVKGDHSTLGNAADWSVNAKSNGAIVDQTPTVGAVAQWESGASGLSWAGHVAIVEKVTAKSITITEDNYSSGPLRTRVITKGSYEWPSNFLHFSTSDKSSAKARIRASSAAVPFTIDLVSNANSREFKRLVKKSHQAA